MKISSDIKTVYKELIKFNHQTWWGQEPQTSKPRTEEFFFILIKDDYKDHT